jgi:dienelactone hydrolase
MSETYYQTEQYFNQRFAVVARQMAFKAATVDAMRVWKHDLRGILRTLMGLEHMVPCPLNSRITGEVQCDGYRRQRVEIDTEPGVTMPMYVLIPDGEHTSLPPVLAAHGHDGGGKVAVAGIDENPIVRKRMQHYNYDYGVKCAQRGYIVFCPDARGFGERRESNSVGDENVLNSSCSQLTNRALSLGMCVAGMWTWDLMRLLDYIQTRPECQGRAIGCIGLSGGGLQILYLAALDERVACAVSSGYFYGMRDSLLGICCCDCNYVPHLMEYVDMGDLACLIAPRPFLVESGTLDDLNGVRGIINAVEQVDIARRAYKLLGAPERIYHDIFEGEHRWNGVYAYPWLDRWLKG